MIRSHRAPPGWPGSMAASLALRCTNGTCRPGGLGADGYPEDPFVSDAARGLGPGRALSESHAPGDGHSRYRITLQRCTQVEEV